MDWDALRDAALVLPPPSPLPPPQALPRAHLLALHAQLAQQERQLDREGQVRTRKLVVGPGKHFSSSSSTASLRPCQLDEPDLVLDKPATGRILVVRILVAPIRTAAVQLVVEDCTGRAAPLSIYHVPARYEQQDLDELWPVGAIYGIKEPLLRSLRSGFHIRVDSPSDLVRLFPSSPLLRQLPSPFPRSPAHALDGKPPSALKDAGNAAVKAARWIRAREAYEWALEALECVGAGASAQGELGATLRSNLALVYLKLDLPAAARHIAERALALVPAPAPSPTGDAGEAPSSLPLRAKLTYRLALAHYALEAYPPCLSALAPLLALAPPDPLAASLADRARARADEAAHGPSPATLRALFRGAPAPPGIDLADYASPLVAVRESPTDPARGRALVALGPIPRGTLVACLKPVVVAGGPAAARGGRRAYCAGVNLWTRAVEPWGVGECAAEVLWRAGEGARAGGEEEGEGGGRDEPAREAVRELWAGDELGRGSEREGAADVEADPSRAEGVVTFNAFTVEDLASSLPGARASSPTGDADADADPSSSDAEGFHALTALYPPLASALNHSCLPTASYTFLGTLFLLRARVDLAPGDELTDSYADATDPLEVRERKLAPHGFVCACGLCVEERGAGEEGRRVREGLVRRLEEEEEPRREEGEELERVRGIKRALEGTYAVRGEEGEDGARVRPPLYGAARLLAQRLADAPGGASPAQLREAVETELEALRALGAVFEPGEGGGEGGGSSGGQEEGGGRREVGAGEDGAAAVGGRHQRGAERAARREGMAGPLEGRRDEALDRPRARDRGGPSGRRAVRAAVRRFCAPSRARPRARGDGDGSERLGVRCSRVEGEKAMLREARGWARGEKARSRRARVLQSALL